MWRLVCKANCDSFMDPHLNFLTFFGTFAVVFMCLLALWLYCSCMFIENLLFSDWDINLKVKTYKHL